jgi:hypothetical protein
MALDDIPKHPDYGTAGQLVASRLVKVRAAVMPAFFVFRCTLTIWLYTM